MAKFSGNELPIGKVYAASLFQLAQEQDVSEAMRSELNELASFVEGNPKFADFLSNPTVDVEARRKVIEKAFRGRLSDVVVDLLQVMNRGNRMVLVGALASAFAAIHEERAGGVEVQICTAVPLSDAARGRLQAVITKKTGKKAKIKESVDPSLLGGLVVRVGDDKLDASVARKLAELSVKMLDRASREIYSGRQYIAS
jgi:F-type H+-transporting ATPase subunit delta